MYVPRCDKTAAILCDVNRARSRAAYNESICNVINSLKVLFLRK